ncbi:MAG: hypothetical protein E7657_07785 [Ruminococcaceae bacterium]|nr:hypothetical protein [Oscillospiraceae bacterium]
MSNLKEIFEEYTALSRASLLAKASRNMTTALTHLRRVKQGNENELLSAIIASAIGADGALSDEELRFVEELFSASLSRDKLSSLAARFEDEKMRSAIDHMVDSLDKEGKRAICTLCLCILASDKTLLPEENAFLIRLMQ